MSIGLLFWIIMIIWLLFGLYRNRTTLIVWVGDGLILWVLLAILGWAVFGPAIHR